LRVIVAVSEWIRRCGALDEPRREPRRGLVERYPERLGCGEKLAARRGADRERAIVQVRDERQRRAVRERPRDGHGPLSEQAAAASSRGEAGQQHLAPGREQPRIARRRVGMIAVGGERPVDARALERAYVVRIRKARELFDAVEELRELAAAAFA